MRRVSFVSLAALGALAWAQFSLAAALDPAAEAIRVRVDHLRYDADHDVRGARIVLGDVVSQFYESRAFAPAWSAPARLDRLLVALQELRYDGLDPVDYHFDALDSYRADLRAGKPLTAEEHSDLELAATDGMVLALFHLYGGKVDPLKLDSHWNFGARPVDEQAAYEFLERALASGHIAEAFDEVRPAHRWYRDGRERLREYLALAAVGGWPSLPDGVVLKPGMSDPQVAPMRQRLRMTRDFIGADLSSETYDAELETAVRAFQERHGITPDGVVGPAARAAMNVPVSARVDQIRVNLERGRWVLHEIGGEFVLVDVAGFNVTYFRDDAPIWTSRVVIGKPYRETPIFRSTITYVVLNPTWTIPPGILAKDKLPVIKRDPGYLKRNNIRVIDRNGREVDPYAVNWRQYGNSIPYQLRQDPGPNNALGLVKIMFPNPHLVYLHDSPAKSLFDLDERAFSSGCIRVHKPFQLAELVLNDPARWNRAAIDKVVASKKMQTINLKTPVTVLILYWTSQPLPDGRVQFRPDVYKRDPATLRALNSDFRVPAVSSATRSITQ